MQHFLLLWNWSFFFFHLDIELKSLGYLWKAYYLAANDYRFVYISHVVLCIRLSIKKKWSLKSLFTALNQRQGRQQIGSFKSPSPNAKVSFNCGTWVEKQPSYRQNSNAGVSGRVVNSSHNTSLYTVDTKPATFAPLPCSHWIRIWHKFCTYKISKCHCSRS